MKLIARSLSFTALLALSAVAHADTIDFDNLPNGTTVTNQYPQVTFSSEAGFQPFTFGIGGVFGTSAPNLLVPAAGSPSGIDGNRELILDFTNPVDNLSFHIVGVNDTGNIGSVDVFQSGSFFATANVIGTGQQFIPDTVDLSAYSNVTRIRVHNITDGGGIGYDDFNFRPVVGVPVPEPGTVALLVGMSLAGIAIRGKRTRR